MVTPIAEGAQSLYRELALDRSVECIRRLARVGSVKDILDRHRKAAKIAAVNLGVGLQCPLSLAGEVMKVVLASPLFMQVYISHICACKVIANRMDLIPHLKHVAQSSSR